MEQEQIKYIKEKLMKLSRIELAYTRNWLMDHYSILAMEHSIKAIVSIMDDVDAKYDDIVNFLDNISDHTQWEIEEALFIEDEKNGSYFIWDAQDLMDDLSNEEWDYFFNLLKDKYPKYSEMKDWDFYDINNSFGKDDYPSWEQAYYMLKEIMELRK